MSEVPTGYTRVELMLDEALSRCRRIARGVPESKWDGLYEVSEPGFGIDHSANSFDSGNCPSDEARCRIRGRPGDAPLP